MTQQIDPAKLRAAAEHLEWALNQYPDSDVVQSLLRSLRPFLEDAKAGRVTEAVDRNDVPGAYNLGDGRYIPYGDPSVDDAYVAFAVELRGGYTDQERRILAKIGTLGSASGNGA